MPCAASIQSVLRSELNIECRMGATYGNAYCGVVGGMERHEYSILGPPVNLAARLMGNGENRGFLVADQVKSKAQSWHFRALTPVVAKGYADPVRIYEPVMHKRSPWVRPHGQFVGREEELRTLLEFVDFDASSGLSSAKMVFVSAAKGFGKSSFLSEAVSQIKNKCITKKHSHLILGQVCLASL